jgi:CHAT domain-containing protein/tetratricopeptide (TPR) repeat protein
MRFLILFFFVLTCQPLLAQDWKALYEQCKQAYEAGQYEQALTDGQKAYGQARTLDVKTEAFTLQLLTVICLDGGFPDKGLRWSEEEAKKFLALEGENSKHRYEALRKQALFLRQSGQLSVAAEKNLFLHELAKKIYGPESYEYYATCFSYGQVLMELGSFSRSREVWNKCLLKLKQFPEGSEDYFYGLYYAAYVDNKLGATQEAIGKWTEFVSIAEENNLRDLDEYKQAKTFLTIAQNKVPPAITPDGQTLQQHLATALDYQNKKQWDLAAQEYALLEKNISPETIFSHATFSHYLNYGRLLFQQRKVGDAYQKVKEAKKIAEKLFSPHALEYGHLQYLEAELKLAEGKATEAQQLYINAFANLKSAAADLQATYLVNASHAMLASGRPHYSLALMQPYVNAGGIAGVNDKHRVDLSIAYCDVLEQLNRNDDAVNYLKEVVALGPPAVKGALQTKLAEALKESGRSQEAINLLQLIQRSSSLSVEAKAEVSYQLARVQQQLGQYVASEKNYLAALDLYSHAHADNGWQAWNSLGTFYTELGNYEAAENIYRDALKAIPGTSSFGNTLKQNLAAIYQQTKRLKEAQRLLEEVVRSGGALGGTASGQYAISLQNLAAIHQKSGEYEKAKALYEEALDIDRKLFGEQSPNYATKLANLATVYEESGALSKARSLFESALKIRETALGAEHPDYVFNQYNLAVLYHRMKEYELARPLYKKIAVFYLQQIRELFPAMSEQEKTAFYSKIQKVITAYQDFAVDYAHVDKNLLSELLDFRLQTKALLLNSSTTMRSRILKSGDTVLIEKFTNWLNTKEQLAFIFSLPAEERMARKSTADALQQKANTAEKELSARSEFFASATEKRSPSWREVQAVLKPGEALVEMIRLRLDLKNDSVIYVALLIKPGLQIPDMVIMPLGHAMENREFLYYRNTIRFRLPNERSYKVYWKSLEPSLAGVNTIYFSPDGIYNKVNMLTLFDPERKQYLIDRLSLKVVSNAKDLLLKASAASPSPQAVLLGYPDYLQNGSEDHISISTETSSPALSVLRGGTDPLPGTKEEVLKIEKLLKSNQWRVNTYLAGEATEEIVKAQRGPALLHIATHGFFIDSPSEEGELVYSQNISRAEHNPLLRSGLLLAGAEKNISNQVKDKSRNDTREDGVLTAYEAMNMNLQHTDLVVLSACETGAGEVRNGEGVYGLQRSFLVAGANNVIMSLWKVNDDATQELMVLFYSHWLTVKDKREAFHLTQLELKKKYTDPFFWGAFVIIGQ